MIHIVAANKVSYSKRYPEKFYVTVQNNIQLLITVD